MQTQPAPISPAVVSQRGVATRAAPWCTLVRLIARHPVASQLAMTYAFALCGMAPLLLSARGVGLLPFAPPIVPVQSFVSFIGLALPAFLVAAATGGRAGVRDLLGRCLRWRVGVRWYLAAVPATFAAMLLLALPLVGAEPLRLLAQKWPLLFTAFLPGMVLPFLHTNLAEETCWTSIQARLQGRHHPLLATAMVAPFFALFHLPTYFVAGWVVAERATLADLPALLIQIASIAFFGIFFRSVCLWLYNGSGRSLLVAGLFHAAFNALNEQGLAPKFIPGPLAADLPPLAVLAVAALVLLATRGRLAHRREPAAEDDWLADRRELPGAMTSNDAL